MKSSIVAAAALAALASVAGADTWQYTWDTSQGGSRQNRAGKFESIVTTYNTDTERLTWSVTFSNQITDGLTLAINDGPNPRGDAGELALLYVDATDASNVRVSSFAYNGENSFSSYRDGDGTIDGDQTPDLIQSASGSVTTSSTSASLVDAGGKRTISFSIDASVINAHTPMYPGAGDWFGIGFTSKIGYWLHTYKGLETEYDSDGVLTSWTREKEGWFDVGGKNATMVPVPTAAGFGFLGLGLAAARRRR